jgi:hypothetical protein
VIIGVPGHPLGGVLVFPVRAGLFHAFFMDSLFIAIWIWPNGARYSQIDPLYDIFRTKCTKYTFWKVSNFREIFRWRAGTDPFFSTRGGSATREAAPGLHRGQKVCPTRAISVNVGEVLRGGCKSGTGVSSVFSVPRADGRDAHPTLWQHAEVPQKQIEDPPCL